MFYTGDGAVTGNVPDADNDPVADNNDNIDADADNGCDVDANVFFFGFLLMLLISSGLCW